MEINLSCWVLLWNFSDSFCGPSVYFNPRGWKVFTLEHAMQAKRGSESIQLYSLFHLGAHWERVVKATPRPPYPRQRYPVPILQEAGWASGPVWTGAQNLAPTGIRSPNRPARSKWLSWLSCPRDQIDLWKASVAGRREKAGSAGAATRRTGSTAVKYSTGDFTLQGSVCSFALFHAFAALGNKKNHFNCLLFLLSNTSGALVKITLSKTWL